MYDHYDIEPDEEDGEPYDPNSPFPDDHNDKDFKSIIKSIGNKKIRNNSKIKKIDNNKKFF